ncbi:MarR family winged helix-turn-helix transcriptional regulator [Paracoccus sp. (in: a-proteobacteria)]|uniref:MarR family winged helix-turn-helix transcriptional regulator n=1 Tax=Paracoccus sp. TaxID=267 RepID=UPI00272A310D|nr:MarR family transcriptional regulator [Paracoccus sp. (in: a-proteobacteria)]
MEETTPELLPRETVLQIRDTCLCLAAQRAARRLARRFDAVLRPFGLTNGQFSLMVALNQPDPPPMGRLAPFLAMDPSTLTAAVKPLARRGLLTVEPDPDDRRSRLLHITPEGVALMRQAAEVWRSAHAALDAQLPSGLPETLRQGLAAVAAAPPPAPLNPGKDDL